MPAARQPRARASCELRVASLTLATRSKSSMAAHVLSLTSIEGALSIMLYDIVGKRYIFFAVSLLILIPGLIALIVFGVKPSIDFTGGTVWEVVPNSGA